MFPFGREHYRDNSYINMFATVTTIWKPVTVTFKKHPTLNFIGNPDSLIDNLHVRLNFNLSRESNTTAKKNIMKLV